jgi:hypothetical protein
MSQTTAAQPTRIVHLTLAALGSAAVLLLIVAIFVQYQVPSRGLAL